MSPLSRALCYDRLDARDVSVNYLMHCRREAP